MFIKILKYFILSVLLVPLVACQSSGPQHYLNALADKAAVIPVPATGTAPQKWQDLYLDIDHSISVTDGAISVQGTVGFANHPQIMYARAQNLKVSLFLLDKNNRVVAYRQILYSGFASPQDKESFNTRMDRPVGVVAYTFGYEVDFIEGEPDAGGTMIWSFPDVNK